MYFLDRAIHQTLIDQMLLLQFSKYLISNINLTNTIYQRLFSALFKRSNHFNQLSINTTFLINPSGSKIHGNSDSCFVLGTKERRRSPLEISTISPVLILNNIRGERERGDWRRGWTTNQNQRN